MKIRIINFLMLFIAISFFPYFANLVYSYNENSIFVKRAIHSTVAITSDIGLGAGVFIHPDGYIVTAKHVVEGASKIRVYTRDWEVYKGRVVALHEKTDIAIIKVELINEINVIEIAPSNTIEPADDVYVIGHTFGVPWTISKGIIARTDWETDDGWKYIQFSSASAQGNSGGPVVDHWGRIVGITVMGMPMGLGNIGFALQVWQFEKWAEYIIKVDTKKMNTLVSW
ncbi:MAG: trypsin-like peptidase domain-containing protein, partial [bacterium]